jgi:hypothetical protein
VTIWDVLLIFVDELPIFPTPFVEEAIQYMFWVYFDKGQKSNGCTYSGLCWVLYSIP